MNVKKWVNLGTFAFLGAVLMFKYQNCAPPKELEEIARKAEEPLPVSVIDDVKSLTKLSFHESQLELQPDSEVVEAEGACDESQTGARLRWALVDGEGNELKMGFASCDSQRFVVDFASAQDLECGRMYQVRAQLGAGQPGELPLVRHCPEEHQQ